MCNDIENIILHENVASLDYQEINPYLLISEPVNPNAIIEAYLDLVIYDSVDQHPTKGGFLIAKPRATSSLERLRGMPWTKLPSVASGIDPTLHDFVWGRLEEFGTGLEKQTSWTQDWKGKNVAKKVLPHAEDPSLIGRLMRLDDQEERLKELIVRRLPILDVYQHKEFEGVRSNNRRRAALIMRLNRERMTNASIRTRYARMERLTKTGVFDLKVANIQTPRQARNPNLKPQGKMIIELDELRGKFEEFCGFSEGDGIDDIPWLFNPDPPEGEVADVSFQDLLLQLDSVELIGHGDSCGMSTKSMEENTRGFSIGLRALIDAAVESGEPISKWVENIAWIYHYAESQRKEDEYRTILQKHDNSISSELIPDFLEAIQIRNTDYNLHEMKKKALDRFQSDLTNFQGKTWHDLIEQWDKNAPADEQWNLFKKSNVLPKIRPVFLWRRENQEFFRANNTTSLKENFLYVSERDGRALFNITGSDSTYSANRWSLDSQMRLFLVEELMESMVPATPIHIPSRIELADHAAPGTDVEFDHRWVFIQALLGLKYHQERQEEDISTAEKFLLICPKMEAVSSGHACSVFGHKHVHVGQTGWNIEINGDGNGWRLQTKTLESGIKPLSAIY